MVCHCPAPTARLFERETGVLPPTLIEVIDVAIGQRAPYESRNRVNCQLKLGLALLQFLFRPLALDDFLSQCLVNRSQFRSPLADTPFEIFGGSSPLTNVPSLLQCDRSLVRRHLQQKTFRLGREIWSSRSGNEYADSFLKAQRKHHDRCGVATESVGNAQTRPGGHFSKIRRLSPTDVAS